MDSLNYFVTYDRLPRSTRRTIVASMIRSRVMRDFPVMMRQYFENDRSPANQIIGAGYLSKHFIHIGFFTVKQLLFHNRYYICYILL